MRNVLSDTKVRKALPQEAPYRLFDGEGLALWVSPSGIKSWQFRYRLDGKPQTATIGKYPVISLADARAKAEELRTLAHQGEHLTHHKRVQKLRKRTERSNTFEAVSADWQAREARRQKWTEDYREEVASSIRNHLAPLASIPLAKLDAPTISPVLRAVEAKAPMMLEKVRRRLNGILDFAVEHGVIQGNPLPAVRRGSKVERKHFPAITDPKVLGAVLRDARAADPAKGIQRAHLLLAFCAQRVSEIIGAKWAEVDLEAGTWAIPRERMKRKDLERGPHVIPIPPQLLAMMKEWQMNDAGSSAFICPAPRDPERSITAEACEKFYHRLGLKGRHSPHSWRSAFSTICREAGKDGDTIEAQLDHQVGNKVASAYDRAQRLELRRKLLTWYEATLIAARDEE